MNDEPYDDLALALAALSFRGRSEIRVTTRLAQEIERDPMYRAWQAIRERAQQDWDRWFGTGEIPPAFRRPEAEPVDPHAEALALNEGARLAREAAGAAPTAELGGHVRDLGYGCAGWVPDSWTVVQPATRADPDFDLYAAVRSWHRALSAQSPFVPWGPA